MSNLEKYEAFFETNSDCLSAAQLDKYAQQKLNKKEKYQFERHLLHCEFCTEAVEGVLAFEKPINLSQISTQINAQIAEKYFPSSTKTIPLFSYLKVAASIIILLTAGLFLFDKGFPDTENLAFSDEKSTTENSPPLDTQSSDDTGLKKDLSTTTAEEELEENKIENTEKTTKVEKKKEIKKDELIIENETKQNQNITPSPTIPKNNDEKEQLTAETQSISTKDVQNDGLSDLAKTIQKSEEKVLQEEVADDFEEILENNDPLMDELELDEDTNIAFQNNQNPLVEKAKARGAGLTSEGGQKRQQKRKPSIKELKKQVKKAPDNLNLRYQYALAYFEAKDWDKSLEQLEKVLVDTTAAHYHDAIWHKALILIEQGKPTLAKEHLNKLLQNDSYKTQAEQKLGEIK